MLKPLFTSFGSQKARMALLCINAAVTIAKPATKEPNTPSSTNSKKNQLYHNQDISPYYQKLENTVKKIIKKNQDMLYVSPLNNEFAEFIVDYIGALKSSRHKRASFSLKKICDELLEEKGLKHKKNIKEGKVALALLKHIGIDRSHEIVRFVLRKKNRPTIIYFKEKGYHYRKNTKTYEEIDVTWGRFEKIALKAQEVEIGEIIKPQASFLDWLLINPKAGLASILSLFFVRDILNEKARLQKENKKLYKILLQGKIEEEAKEHIRVLFTPSKAELQGSVERQDAGQGMYNFGNTCHDNALIQSLIGTFTDSDLFNTKKRMEEMGATLDMWDPAQKKIWQAFSDIATIIQGQSGNELPNKLIFNLFKVLDEYGVHTEVNAQEDPAELLTQIMALFSSNLIKREWAMESINFNIRSKGNLESFQEKLINEKQSMGGENGSLENFLIIPLPNQEEAVSVQNLIDQDIKTEEGVELSIPLNQYLKEVHDDKTLELESEEEIKKAMAIQLVSRHNGFPLSWRDAVPKEYRKLTTQDLIKKSKEDWVQFKTIKHAVTGEELTGGTVIGGIKKVFSDHNKEKKLPEGFTEFMQSCIFINKHKINEKDFTKNQEEKIKKQLNVMDDIEEAEDIFKRLRLVPAQDDFDLKIDCNISKAAKSLKATGDTVIIQLKRFDSQLRKINTPIKGAQTIRIGGEVFELVACIAHGGPYGHGHYISYIKNTDDLDWKLCDDTSVSKKNTKEIKKLIEAKKNGGYILFYKKPKEENN